MNQEFSHHESLRIIHTMIEKTKQNIFHQSHYFLFWGWGAFIGFTVQYILKVFFHYLKHYGLGALLWVPVLLLLFRMPTFISGCINKFAPFIFGGVACWLLCIVAFFYNSYFNYLLVAAGAGVAWIIPGFILRARFKKNLVNHIDGL